MGRKTIIGLFAVISLFFYFSVFSGRVPLNGNLLVAFFNPWQEQVPFKFMGVDEIRELYPLLDFTYDSIKNGSIPLWNPYNFSGYPHLANWASAVFYPLNIVMLFLSKLNVLIFLKLSAIILSGFFTYLYLRCLSLNKLSAFFGGVVFASSAPMLIWGSEIWQSVHSMLWLPLTLFCIEKLINTKKLVYVALLAFSLAASIMAGYIQPAIYIFIFTFFYLLFRVRSITKKTLALIAVGLMLAVGLSAIHTMPGVEAFLLSPRKEISLLNVNLDFLLAPIQILTLFVPDIFGHIATQNWFLIRPGQYYENMIYIGVVPLVLSSLAIFYLKLRSWAIFYLAVAALTLSTTFDLPTSRLIYQLHIPFLSTAIPIRITLVTAFSVSILSALGMAWWLEQNKMGVKKAITALLPLILTYLVIILSLYWFYSKKILLPGFPSQWYIISLRNSLLPSLVFLVSVLVIIITLFFARFKYLGYVTLTTALLFHASFFFQKYASFTDREFIYPPHPLISYLKDHQGLYRYLGYGKSYLVNNLATVYKLYSPEGYDPVNIKSYNQLLSSLNTGDLHGIASRSDAVIPAEDIYPPQDSNSLRLKLLDLLGVKFVGYYGDKPKKNPINERFLLVWEDNNFMIFENQKAYQRAFLVPQAIYALSEEEAIKIIYSEETDLSKKVILQEKIDIPDNDLNLQGKVAIEEYKPNMVTIKASTDASQFLVLSDAYYPGWQATVNGKPAKIYRADYALRAVILPKGESEVVFKFNPTSFMLGSFVSGLSTLVIIFIFIINKLKWKKRYGYKT